MAVVCGRCSKLGSHRESTNLEGGSGLNRSSLIQALREWRPTSPASRNRLHARSCCTAVNEHVASAALAKITTKLRRGEAEVAQRIEERFIGIRRCDAAGDAVDMGAVSSHTSPVRGTKVISLADSQRSSTWWFVALSRLFRRAYRNVLRLVSVARRANRSPGSDAEIISLGWTGSPCAVSYRSAKSVSIKGG
jgi:hypothetical protein